jgi:hypothetical protein
LYSPRSATRDLAVGRLEDLGGVVDSPVPDLGVRVGERPLGGMQSACSLEATEGRRWVATAAHQRW